MIRWILKIGTLIGRFPSISNQSLLVGKNDPGQVLEQYIEGDHNLLRKGDRDGKSKGDMDSSEGE